MRYSRRHHSAQTHEPTQAVEGPWVPPLLIRGVSAGATACCCPALAQYAVYLSTSFDAPQPAEILLCGHHLRASAERLAQPDVAVYDLTGRYVDMHGPIPMPAATEPIWSLPEDLFTDTLPAS